jgi:hypothetical protein
VELDIDRELPQKYEIPKDTACTHVEAEGVDPARRDEAWFVARGEEMVRRFRSRHVAMQPQEVHAPSAMPKYGVKGMEVLKKARFLEARVRSTLPAQYCTKISMLL